MDRRKLSDGELAILELIRSHYGFRNTPEEVIFSDQDEAVIWVKEDDGSIPLMVNLTNLAKWRANGMIPTEEELLREWLRIEES